MFDPTLASVGEWASGVSSVNGLRGLVSLSPRSCTKDHKGLPGRFPSAHEWQHGRHPLQWLTRGHSRLSPAPPGSTSSISSCRSAECPGEAILQHPGLFKAHQGQTSLWGSLLSHSWLQCQNPQNAQNLPRPPGHQHL